MGRRKKSDKKEEPLSLGRTIGIIFKISAILLIVAVYAVIMLRIRFMKVPGNMSDVTFTKEVMASLNGEKNEGDIMLQNPSESYDVKGLYNVSEVAVCKSAKQVQFTLRYNSKSTIEALENSYSFTDIADGELFVCKLKDSNGNIYTKYKYASAEKPLSVFRRIIFDGVEITDDLSFYVEIYYIGDINEKSPMAAEFILFDKDCDSYIPPLTKTSPTDLVFIESPEF